ncbi:hypothetical protein M7I_2357 [Glarea lozoyensis 74030]|uniref:Uncharacterized protein n=1 Tax=Glarea lozoyensis (strain ATCC 74030 / MF5533) TaxID=1104152 RepID=H0EIJ8_GLAL7|nr:hypothetical protein M7I_2357 [Glarea lozoyensis 74030]
MAARREFRLRLSKGEPLRDRIYSEALIMSNPITVCSITESHDDDSYYDDELEDKDDEGRTVYEEKFIVTSSCYPTRRTGFRSSPSQQNHR